MAVTLTRRFISDNQYESAPPIPTDRPPTRAEVWAHVQHYYEGVKTREEMEGFAKATFIGNYVRWVNLQDWRKPPDWTPGELEPPAACPTGPIYPEQMQAKVYELLAAKEGK